MIKYTKEELEITPNEILEIKSINGSTERDDAILELARRVMSIDAEEDWYEEQLSKIGCYPSEFIFCGDDGSLYHEENMTFLENEDIYVNHDNMPVVECYIQGYMIRENQSLEVRNRQDNIVFIHEDVADECVSTDDGYSYVDCDAAEHCGYTWCEYSEEWTQHPRSNSNATFNNHYLTRIKPGRIAPKHASFADKLTNQKVDIKHGASTLSYRETEGISYKFGVEIETDSCDPAFCLQSEAKSRSLNISSVYDGSISGNEYVTGILSGDAGFKNLQKICKYLHEADCKVNKACGIHVHVSGFVPSRDFQMRAIMLGMLIQDEVFEFLPSSRKDNTYCKKIKSNFCGFIPHAKKNTKDYKRNLKLLMQYVSTSTRMTFDKDNNKQHRHPNGRYCSSRYKWLNLNNCAWRGKDTIEFRMHSSSIQYEKVKNAVLIDIAIVKYIENNSRLIHDAFADYLSFNSGALPKINKSITFADIINSVYSEGKAAVLLSYIEMRKAKFMAQL